ncbi:MAG: hypothetical protein NC204_06440 [Candidatus Amulumruptor caecigallinarius]|nr:hypothetical protein [Candidatus Amulumruptor caecigallinarius]
MKTAKMIIAANCRNINFNRLTKHVRLISLYAIGISVVILQLRSIL